MTRILIADDHALLREGMKHMLARHLDAPVFGEAGNAREALELATRQAWNIILVDIDMPGRSGLDLIRDLKSLHPKLPVLVVSMHSEEAYGLRVLRAGAAGFVNKESGLAEVVQAVKKVLAGGRYVSPTLAETLAANLQSPGDAPLHHQLSDREYEVLRMLAEGRALKEMAAEMLLSVKTVSTYRRRLLEKLGLRSNVELVRYAIEHDLLNSAGHRPE